MHVPHFVALGAEPVELSVVWHGARKLLVSSISALLASWPVSDERLYIYSKRSNPSAQAIASKLS